MAEDIFDEKNEAQPQSVHWGQVGDFISGTKISQKSGVKTKYGNNIKFEILADKGMFHAKGTGEVVTINAGEVWTVWGRNDIFDAPVKRMQIGQKLGLKFVEDQPSSMGNNAKIIKVYTTGEMNEEWLAANQGMEGDYQTQ